MNEQKDYESQSDKTKDSIPFEVNDNESVNETWECLQYLANELASMSKDHSKYLTENSKKSSWRKDNCGCYMVLENRQILSNETLKFLITRSKQLLDTMKSSNKGLEKKYSCIQEKYNNLLEKYNESLETKMSFEGQLSNLKEKVHQLKAENFKLSVNRLTSPDRNLFISNIDQYNYGSNKKSCISYRDNSPITDYIFTESMLPKTGTQDIDSDQYAYKSENKSSIIPFDLKKSVEYLSTSLENDPNLASPVCKSKTDIKNFELKNESNKSQIDILENEKNHEHSATFVEPKSDKELRYSRKYFSNQPGSAEKVEKKDQTEFK